MTVIGITLSKKAHTNVVTHINLQRNSSGENMNRCYEILELNNEIQKRLYSILSDTSRDGKSVPCLITNYTHFAFFPTLALSVSVLTISYYIS